MINLGKTNETYLIEETLNDFVFKGNYTLSLVSSEERIDGEVTKTDGTYIAHIAVDYCEDGTINFIINGHKDFKSEIVDLVDLTYINIKEDLNNETK